VNLPRYSVEHPVTTTMLTLMLLLLGLVSFSRLRIDLLPTIELPTVSVRTNYEGASPEVMERLVTRILEEIVATVPGIEEMSSQSTEGRSSISVTFAWGTNIDSAALDLQATIENELNELPDDITRPRISKFDVNSFPVVLLGVSSSMDPVDLTDLIEDQLRFRFARIPGVAQVDTWGSFTREIRIALDPERLKALELPLDQVLESLRSANLDLPAGNLEQGRYEVVVRAPAEFRSLREIEQTVLSLRGDAVLRVSDVAEVIDTHEKKRRNVRINGENGIRVAIRKQAEANTVEVSQAVLAEMEEINRDYPQIEVVPVINQGNFIERSIANVTQSVLYGGGLSLLVLLLFLRNLRSTLVIALAIPLSILATFCLLFFGGFTLNLMTLGGLALGVGMMVDSSVVVLENIFRRQDEEGEDPRRASIEGAREVSGAILASTLTTLVIFLPMVFVRGVSGLLFREFAMVVVFSLSCSLLVSLSLVPMFASRLLRSPEQLHQERPQILEALALRAESLFQGMDDSYRSLLGWVIRHRILTLTAALSLLGASLLLYPKLGSEFLPPSDEGEVRVSGEMEVGTRLDLITEQALRLEELVFAAVPERVAGITSAGPGRRGAGSRADIRLSLSPASARDRSNQEVANQLRKELDGKLPGLQIRIRAPQGQFLLQRILGGEESLNVEIRGFDLDTLAALAARVEAELSEVEGVTDIDSSLEKGRPQQDIHIDREKAANLGISPRDIARYLETALAGSRAGEYRVEGDSIPIRVQLKDAERRNMDELLDLTLRSASGEAVALRNLMDSQAGSGPLQIDRKDQQRLLEVTADLENRDQGSAAAEIRERLQRIPTPEGYELRLAGSVEEQEESRRDMMLSLGLALLLVYMVLACQYESLLNPFIVMFSVPMAAVGVLVTLFLTETTLNLQSGIGCIMLAGIVVNNAILLVDQSSRLLQAGYERGQAVSEAGRRRLRPILMTTLTTILALLPLAFGIGEGADAQAPLARAVVGGLSGATLITLLIIPALFHLLHPPAQGKGPNPAP